MKDHKAGNGANLKRVLVADDDLNFRDSLAIALKREQTEVWQAGNSDEVLDLLDDREFDLLMMDLRLGPQLGVEVAEWARLRHPRLPVIFMSAYPYTEMEGRITRISPYRVLEKPFDVTVLDEILEEETSRV